MKKQNRKAFTIVELVIVIAVIAILAAVLIPTFSGIIESANRTVDTQLVAQINTILAVEDVLGGGINEVVDIQNAIKKHGLKLETKSKGAYLWYDRDSGKVVLGSLDDNNNLEIIFGDDSQQSNSLKGKFDINMISLEGFIHGYYFISEESNDKFAEKICAVRNSDSETELRDALTEVTDVNASIGQQFRVFLNTHPLITSSGVVFLGGDENRANATTAIVGGRVTEITANVIDQLKAFDTAIDHIDLHPGVTAVDVSIGSLDIEFFHSSLEVDAFCKEKGITNVHLKGERDKFIQSMNIVYIDTNGDRLTNTVGENEVAWSGNNPELNKIKWKITLAPWLDSQATNTDKVYDFVGYSFEDDGSTSISLGTSNYFLTEADKTKVNENTGAITIYAVYELDATPDFKVTVGETVKYYGSRAMTYKLYTTGAFANGTTITVCSTDAVLDASLIGLAKAELTIPDKVELLLPTYGYGTTEEVKNGEKTGVILLGDRTNTYEKFLRDSKLTLVHGSYDKEDYLPGGKFNKDEITGETKLTISDNVELVISSGAGLYVDAVRYHAGTTYQNFTDDKCGVLEINKGAKITSNGDITAYGVIRGKGEIVANGGTVKEPMTIYDWYGGTNAAVSVGTKSDDDDWIGGIGGAIGGLVSGLDLSGKNVCPFNEWKVDNLRVKTTLTSGCDYSAVVGIQIGKPIIINNFVLASGEGQPLFLLGTNSDGTKAYIEKTMETDTNGELTGDIKLTIHGKVDDTNTILVIPNVVSGFSATIDFQRISMPISHMDIHIAEGSTLTISNNIYKVLPGSSIVVETGFDGAGTRIDGTLNINTNVVICNSYDLRFKESNTRPANKYVVIQGTNNSEAWEIEYRLSENQECYEAWKYKCTATGETDCEGNPKWARTGEDPVRDANYDFTPPYVYPINTPAELVIKGTLNFGDGAAFAGKITIGDEGATMTASVSVGGCTIPEGFTSNKVWYSTYADKLYQKAVLVGTTEVDIGVGTYKYGSIEVDGSPLYGWILQPTTP